MNQIPQSSLLNPAVRPPVKAYLGLPLLGGIRAGVFSNGFGPNQVDYGEDYILPYIDFASWLPDLGRRNRFSVEADIQLLNLGIRVGKGFIGLGSGERLSATFSYHEPLIRMLSDIQAGGENAPGQRYDLGAVHMNAAHYRSFYVSYAHELSPRLSVGGRFHYLRGMAAIWSENEGLTFMRDPNRDYFRIDGRMDYYAAGLSGYDELFAGSSFWPRGGNSGYAVDLGAVFRVDDRWSIAASALNLGALTWKEDLTAQVLSAETASFSVRDIRLFEDELNVLIDSLVDGSNRDGYGFFRTPLTQYYYLSGAYQWRPNTSFTAMLHPRLTGEVFDFGFGLSANTRLGRWLGVSAAYSAIRNNFLNLGLGFNLDLGPLQLYAVTDNVTAAFSYRTARNAHFQVGLNLQFGRLRPEDLLPAEEAVADEPVADEPELARREERQRRRDERAAARREARQQRRETRLAVRREQAEAPPVITAPADTSAAPVHSPYFTFVLTAKQDGSGSRLRGLSLEIYRLAGNRRELVFIGSAYGGTFSIPLLRDDTHLIIVSKLTYQPDRYLLSPAEVGAATEVRHEFTLSGPLADDRQDTPLYLDVIEAVSLRAGPGDEYEEILPLREGDRVELLERTNPIWWKVRRNGDEGYVPAAALVR